ncbi:Putative cation-transporting P-type ATPase [Raoultella ornithinolytica]|nr:Putative cation-transporting P-type ATPase [Raoultella ornithinolytica]
MSRYKFMPEAYWKRICVPLTCATDSQLVQDARGLCGITGGPTEGA